MLSRRALRETPVGPEGVIFAPGNNVLVLSNREVLVRP